MGLIVQQVRQWLKRSRGCKHKPAIYVYDAATGLRAGIRCTKRGCWEWVVPMHDVTALHDAFGALADELDIYEPAAGSLKKQGGGGLREKKRGLTT